MAQTRAEAQFKRRGQDAGVCPLDSLLRGYGAIHERCLQIREECLKSINCDAVAPQEAFRDVATERGRRRINDTVAKRKDERIRAVPQALAGNDEAIASTPAELDRLQCWRLLRTIGLR